MNRNSLTLLAVLTLCVFNLFAGISTQNKPLILASAAISAALALFYIARQLIASRRGEDDTSPVPANGAAKTAPKVRSPIWVFAAILFIIVPALMWALLTLAQ